MDDTPKLSVTTMRTAISALRRMEETAQTRPVVYGNLTPENIAVALSELRAAVAHQWH